MQHIVLQLLKDLRDGNVPCTTAGICYNINVFIQIEFIYNRNGNAAIPKELFHAYMRKAVEGWEHYSGMIKYPIMYGDDAIVSYHTINNCWGGEYGKLRYELLDRLIKVAEEHCNERKENETPDCR